MAASSGPFIPRSIMLANAESYARIATKDSWPFPPVRKADIPGQLQCGFGQARRSCGKRNLVPPPIERPKDEPMRFCHSLLITALTLAGLLPLSAANAQPQATPTIQPMPSGAELDALWTARKWNDLGAALSHPDSAASFTRSMDWLHTRLDAGGGLLLGLLYARDLWLVGESQNVTDPAKDLRMTAAMITLYTYEIIVIDGAKCEDKSAPGHRVEQLLTARRETLAYLRQQPPEWKTNVINIAIAYEKKTAPLRREDDLICRGGLEEIRAGLEKGTQHEVPNTDGHYGKTVDVRPPSDWMPKFVAPSAYQPLQEKARTDMRATLLRLVD
jgi:hypothetical protein